LPVVFLSNNTLLWAENSPDDAQAITLTSEDRAFTAKICSLLSTGHSPHDIVKFLNYGKEHSLDHQKLVTDIDYLLQKQYQPHDVMNIVVQNKESEEYYARKNFMGKLKIFASCVTTALVLYGLVHYYSHGLPDTGQGQRSGGSGRAGGMGEAHNHVIRTTKKTSQSNKKPLVKKLRRLLYDDDIPVPFDDKLDRACARQIAYAQKRGWIPK